MSSSTKDDHGAKKFLFDHNDFGAVKPKADEPIYTEAQLLLAKEQSQLQGKADGVRETRQAQEEATLKCLEKIITLCEKLILAEDRRQIEQLMETVRLTARVTHKLLPQFAEKYSMDEIERVITQAIDARRDEPRIAITVPTMHLDTLKDQIDGMAVEKGYAGKLILIADDHMSPSDVRVEWADGGAERMYERLYAQIETEFAKAIAGMQETLKNTK